MKKLSEYKDERAIELLADIMEPAVAILGDKAVGGVYRAGNTMGAIQLALKNHAKNVMQIMATLEDTPLEKYHCNVMTLPRTLLDIINDPEMQSFFSSLASNEETESSGGATEPTPGTEEK